MTRIFIYHLNEPKIFLPICYTYVKPRNSAEAFAANITAIDPPLNQHLI